MTDLDGQKSEQSRLSNNDACQKISTGHFIFRNARHFNENGLKLKKLFLSSKLCDVTIHCHDQSTCKAHRVVLAAASDYFTAMFTSSMTESKADEIVINGVDPSTLQCLIEYCYTGEVSLSDSTVENIMCGASLLQLDEVVDACCDYLLSQLHASNCLGIKSFADAQGCEKLRNTAASFIFDHFPEVSGQNEFLLLPVDELYSVLSSDDLNVPCETIIFDSLCLWLDYDVDNRRHHAPRLLSAVRLTSLPPKFLAENVRRRDPFVNNIECERLISDAYEYMLLKKREIHVSQVIPSVSCQLRLNIKARKAALGSLYIVGGTDSNKGATSIEKYDYVKDQWVIVGHISNRRLQFGVAVLGTNIFLVGGREGLKALNSVDCWDSATGVWSSANSMNAPRHGLAVVVLENVIYAIGGHDGWSYLSSVERWYPEAPHNWFPVAEMNCSRSGAGAAVLNGRIYVIGGRDGSQCLRSCESYDPHTNKWSPIANMFKKRGSVGVAALNGYIYVVGGLESPSCNGAAAFHTRYCCVERYDPLTDQWTFISNLSVNRDGVAVHALGDCLFAAGGYSGQHYVHTVEIYDPETSEWTKAGDLVNGRAGSCAAVIYSKHVVKNNEENLRLITN